MSYSTSVLRWQTSTTSPMILTTSMSFFLQEDIQAMLSSIDKSLHGAETGELSKVELREALEAFFLVGQPGGKTLNRMEEIVQARPIMTSP